MKFVLLISEDVRATRRSPAEVDRILAGHRAVGRDLRAQGKLVDAHRLSPATDAVTIRHENGVHVVVDGPFTEAKECVGGFYLIECDSPDEAMAWAKRLPLHEGGTIEVRPARTGAQWRGPVRETRKFIVMFVSSEGHHTRRPRADVFRDIDEHYELSLDLTVRGKFVASRSLDGRAAAATLRWSDGAPLITDGPFAETKEVVLGYFVLACDSKDEAVEWGKRLMGGSDAVEVRPLSQ